jgi:hypothetical protein
VEVAAHQIAESGHAHEDTGLGCATIDSPPGATGLRWFDHYQDLDRRLPFSQAATALQLLQEVGNGAESVPPQLHNRIRKIKPEASDAEIDAVLSSSDLPLGTNFYVYMQDDVSRNLVLSQSPPPTLVTQTNADGTLQSYNSEIYSTLGYTTNPFVPNPPYGRARAFVDLHDATFYGQDHATFTPGSGYKGNLGVLEFSNTASGGGQMCCVN